ncbi:MAM and LDL-receptor class A domain-containing 2, partial [Paramuricea clavata]
MKLFFQLFTGYYLFIETSSPRQFGDKAIILTPYLDGPQCMNFSYHMYGGDIGVLNIYANNQRMFSKSGNQGNRWVGVETPILQGGRYMVKFEGVSGRGYEGDIAIDAISFTPGSCSFQTPKPSTPRPTNPPTTSTLRPTNPPTTSTPRPTNPPTTSTPRPTNPPTTSTPRPTNPPTTSTPRPTNPPTTSTPRPTNPPTTSTPRPTNPPTTSTPRPTNPPTTSTPRPTNPPTTSTPRPTNPPTTSTQSPTQAANCNFDNGDTCSYQNGAGQFNWTVNRGQTPSSGTGPSSDVSGRGFYLFIETSFPRQFGDNATILTPYLNGSQCMKFSYHMYGGGIGILNIYANNQKIFSKSGNQGNRWVGVETPILQFGRYMVKFEGVRGRDYQGDIAIDEISFTPGSCSANCNFDNGDTCSYQNGAGQFNWTVNRGPTPSRGTGPSSDVSGRGFYLFIEASSPQLFGDNATVLTPYLNGQQCMKFSYHMYGGDIGVLNIYANNQRVFSKSGNQGNRWLDVETPILERGRYMVKFEGVRGNDCQGDIAIDAISFTPGSCSANCNFDKGDTCNYQNGAGQFNWTVNRGPTPSRGTGPSSDVSGRGFYLFIEASSPQLFGDNATILTPYLNGPQCMKFSYHMYGGDIGVLNIYANNQRMFSRSGNQGNRWVGVETPILQFGSYMVKFEGVRGHDCQGDIAIDAISFTPGSCSFQTPKPSTPRPTNPQTASTQSPTQAG